MSNFHRITWFDNQVRHNRYPNSTSLSQEFEISNRQALRDIEYLVNTMGAPLQYVAKFKGYHYTEPTYMLPYQIISVEEQKVLAFLSYRYGQYRYEDSPTVTRLASLFKRLSGEQTDVADSYPFFAVHEYIIDIVHTINEAIKAKQYLSITYQVGESDISQTLLVEPITLLFKDNMDYLVAYNPNDNQEILLNLHHITTLHPSNEQYIKQRSYRGGLHSLQKKPYIASVFFHEILLGDSWMGYSLQSVENQIYAIEFYNIESFLNNLLSASSSLQLLGPEWLKEKLREKCQAILQSL